MRTMSVQQKLLHINNAALLHYGTKQGLVTIVLYIYVYGAASDRQSGLAIDGWGLLWKGQRSESNHCPPVVSITAGDGGL